MDSSFPTNNGLVFFAVTAKGEPMNYLTVRQHRITTRLYQLRWLLLGVFIIGYLLTRSQLSDYEAEYFVLTTISTALCAALLVRLRTFAVSSLPIWILLVAFMLGYYIKFYWLVLSSIVLNSDTVPFSMDRLALASTPVVAIGAFKLTTLGFAVFCGISTFVCKDRKDVEQRIGLSRNKGLGVATVSAIGGGSILVLTTIIAANTGLLNVAVMGVRTSFRLAGWLSYIRSSVLPILFLLVLYIGLSARSRRWTAIGVILIFVSAVSNVLISTTRGSLFMAVLMVGFMLVVSRRRIINARWGQLLVVFILVGLVLFPQISRYRYLRADGSPASISLLVKALAQSEADSGGILAVFQDGVNNTLARFIGVDSLLFLVERYTWAGFDSLGNIFAIYGNIANYFTREVVGYAWDLPHADAPSLLGWFYIVGGIWGIVFGFGMYLVAGWWVWSWIKRSLLMIKPVAQVIFLMQWLSFSSEGTLDSSIISLSSSILTLGILEFWMRRNAHSSRGSENSRLVKAHDSKDIKGWRMSAKI
jgi:hypothetical protein